MKAICMLAAQIRDRGFKRSNTSAGILEVSSNLKATDRADRMTTLTLRALLADTSVIQSSAQRLVGDRFQQY